MLTPTPPALVWTCGPRGSSSLTSSIGSPAHAGVRQQLGPACSAREVVAEPAGDDHLTAAVEVGRDGVGLACGQECTVGQDDGAVALQRVGVTRSGAVTPSGKMTTSNGTRRVGEASVATR